MMAISYATSVRVLVALGATLDGYWRARGMAADTRPGSPFAGQLYLVEEANAWDQGNSARMRFDLAGGYLRIYVDEELRGVVNLATFHGGALLGRLDASTNDFVSVGYAQAAFGTPVWSDNFQVGTP